MKAFEQAVASAEVALQSNILGQEVGIRTNLDVLNVQQNVYSTRRDLANAYFQYMIAVLRLKSAVGDLTEQDLEDAQPPPERVSFDGNAPACGCLGRYASVRGQPRPQAVGRAAVRGVERDAPRRACDCAARDRAEARRPPHEQCASIARRGARLAPPPLARPRPRS